MSKLTLSPICPLPEDEILKAIEPITSTVKVSKKGYESKIQIPLKPGTSVTIKSSTVKESKIYESFFAQLEKRSKNNNNSTPGRLQSDFSPLWYFSQQLDSKLYLIGLQDLESRQFTSPQFGSTLDLTQALITMETLARFHASSYFYQGSKTKARTEILPTNFPYLSSHVDRNLVNNMTPIVYQFFELCCACVETENSSMAFKLRKRIPNEETLSKKFWNDALLEEKYENDDLFVFCHGDLRPQNIFFDNLKDPQQCKFVEWNSVSYAPLGSDLAYFMFLCVSPGVREEYEEKLLAFYCDAFEEQLGGRIDNFEIDEFHRNVEDQYRRMLEWAFYQSCFFLPILYYGVQNNSIGTSFDHWVQNSEHGRSQWLESVKKYCLNHSELRKRLIDNVKKLVKLRILY